MFGIHQRQKKMWVWHLNETTFDTRSCGFNPAMFIAPASGLRFGEVGRAAEVKMDTVLSEVEG